MDIKKTKIFNELLRSIKFSELSRSIKFSGAGETMKVLDDVKNDKKNLGYAFKLINDYNNNKGEKDNGRN